MPIEYIDLIIVVIQEIKSHSDNSITTHLLPMD